MTDSQEWLNASLSYLMMMNVPHNANVPNNALSNKNQRNALTILGRFKYKINL